MSRFDPYPQLQTLIGGSVARSARSATPWTVEIEGDRISDFSRPSNPIARSGHVIDLSGHLLLPGLINAHDHLEFALFPRLGRGPYPSAKAWADDIYRPEESPLREHLRIPKPQRLLWGGVKNLLSGVTTVCHHNPYEADVFGVNFPVRVVEHFGWAHSLDFSGDVGARFRATPEDAPFILHVGEATDEGGREEIFRLAGVGALDHRTVLVHGVALDDEGLALVRDVRASIAWCPSSNVFTLGRTLDPQKLDRIPLALATDSSLTAEGDLWDELRFAARISGLDADQLYRMVTGGAADVLRLRRGEGHLAPGTVADLIALRDRGEYPCESLLQARISDLRLVIVGGLVKLAAAELAEQMDDSFRQGLHCVKIDQEEVFWIAADIAGMIRTASAALSVPTGSVELAGQRLTAV